jgi:D-lactate dehydrogenase (cytochrome)
MSFPKRVHAPSRALLSALSRTPAAPTLRPAATSKRRWASTQPTQPEEGRSFKGQLFVSTAARLEKERQERERFAKQRSDGRAGKNAAFTFGTSPVASLMELHKRLT